MGYLADEKGKWDVRWKDIHRLSPADRKFVSAEEQESFLKMEKTNTEDIIRFFLENSVGRSICETVEQSRASIDRTGKFAWSFIFRSTFMEKTRTPVIIKLGVGPNRIKSIKSQEGFKNYCQRCKGTGMPQPNSIHTGASLNEALSEIQATEGYLAKDRLQKMLPASIWDANCKIWFLLDKARGEGHFDKVVKRIEETVDHAPKRHLLEYRFKILSRIESKGLIAVSTIHSNLSPMAACTIGRDGTEIDFSSWWEAYHRISPGELSYFEPCPVCKGAGSRLD